MMSKRNTEIAAVYALLLTFAAISSYNVWTILSLTVIPPGRMTPLSLMALRGLKLGSISLESLRPHILLSSLLQGMVGDELAALKISAVLFYAIIPLTAVAAYIITGSLIGTLSAGLVAALYPAFYLPLLSGDYGFISSIALTQLSLTLTLRLLYGGGLKWLAAAAGALLLANLSDAAAPILIIPLLSIWIVWLWIVKPAQSRAVYPLALLMLNIGIALLLTPLNIESPAPALRETVWAPRLLDETAPLIFLGATSLAGGLVLAQRYRRLTAPALAWPLAGIVLSLTYEPAILLYSIPTLIYIASAVLLYLRGFYKFSREKGGNGEDEEIVVELQLDKLASVALGLLLIVSTVSTTAQIADKIRVENTLSMEELGILETVGHKVSGITQKEVIVAPSRIAAWLSALSGIKTVLALSGDEARKADAVTETTFRMLNPYLMIDEWQPFSSKRNPFIYSFDGRIYAKILHLDDGFNKMRVVESGITRLEDLHGMRLESYAWKETPEDISLHLYLWKEGFNATKVVRLSKDRPEVEISYLIAQNHGVKLLNISIPVYIEGRHKIVHRVSDNSIELDTPVKVRVEYLSASTRPELVLSEVQDYVVANYSEVSGVINASLRITLLNPKSSGEKPWYTSFFDLLKERRVNYLLTYTPSGLGHLEDAIERPLQALEVIDAFNRVLLNHGGVDYVEAPACAEVLEDHASASGRSVRYKTAGLIIEKRIETDIERAVLTYAVWPWKNDTRLTSMTISLWIPWGRTVYSDKVGNGYVNLTLDAGTLSIRVSEGKLTHAWFGPHPEYGQLRVQLQFSLNPENDTLSIEVLSKGRLDMKYTPSSRPKMEGSDIMVLSVYGGGPFQKAYSDERFTLYKILPP